MRGLYLYFYWRTRRFVQAITKTLSWYFFSALMPKRAREQRATLKLLCDSRISIPTVRIGGPSDGGYECPERVWSQVDALFSPGVSLVSNFEYEFALNGIPCFLADASIDAPSLTHPNFQFRKAWISSRPIDDNEFLSLAKWIEISGYAASGNLALQMDIEGSEWEVILSTPRTTLEQFAFIISEFHYLQTSLSRESLKTVREAWGKLLDTHVPVWIHPNNGDFAIPFGSRSRIPALLEVCLVRRDLAQIHESVAVGGSLDIQPLNDKRFRPLRGIDWLEH